jgi:hypothetical protein
MLGVREAVEASAAQVLKAARPLSTAQIDSTRSIGFAMGPSSDLADSRIMHPIFQHETITDPWTESLRFLDA